MHYNPWNLKWGLKDACSFLHFQVHRLSAKSISHARNIKRWIIMKNAFFDWEGKQGRKNTIPLAPVTPSLVYFWSHLCLDRGFGLVFRGQGLPEEQLEHSRRNAGVDFSHWHPGVSHLELRHQDPGHAQSPEAAEDAEAAAVSVLPGDVKMQNIWCYPW